MASDFEPSSSVLNLLALIPDENKLHFSTLPCTPLFTTSVIMAKVGEILDTDTGCYMLVTGVTRNMVRPLREEREEHSILLSARFTYEPPIESLIIRVMPGARQANVSRSFFLKIQDKVANIPGHSENSLCPVWGAEFGFPCGRTKEGDWGFKPVSTRGEYGEWPSLMVEVGYSGSLHALRCDAQMWLENSGGRINMVIIIEIAEDPTELRLECWEMIVQPNGRVARNGKPLTPGFSQYLDIDHAGMVSPAGHDLVIPYGTLFDLPQHGDPDIVLSAGELSEWALITYRRFRHLKPHVQQAVVLLEESQDRC